jgi:hypothetical protein
MNSKGAASLLFACFGRGRIDRIADLIQRVLEGMPLDPELFHDFVPGSGDDLFNLILAAYPSILEDERSLLMTDLGTMRHTLKLMSYRRCCTFVLLPQPSPATQDPASVSGPANKAGWPPSRYLPVEMRIFRGWPYCKPC